MEFDLDLKREFVDSEINLSSNNTPKVNVKKGDLIIIEKKKKANK